MADKNIQLKSKTGDTLFPKNKGANVTLAYNGKTVENALKEIQEDVWKDFELINNFEPYSSADKVQYKKLNGIVYFRGSLKGNTTGNRIGTLPTGYRPSQVVRIPYLSSVGSKYCSIESDGNVTLNEYSSANSFVSIDGIWFIL